MVKSFKMENKELKHQYTKNELIEAYEKVRNYELSINEAAKDYDIPRSTLYDKVRLRTPLDKNSPGPALFLTYEEEEALIRQIKSWPVNEKVHLIIPLMVKDILDAAGRNAKFKDNMPSIGWIRKFYGRHPELVTVSTPKHYLVSPLKFEITNRSNRGFDKPSYFKSNKDNSKHREKRCGSYSRSHIRFKRKRIFEKVSRYFLEIFKQVSPKCYNEFENQDKDSYDDIEFCLYKIYDSHKTYDDWERFVEIDDENTGNYDEKRSIIKMSVKYFFYLTEKYIPKYLSEFKENIRENKPFPIESKQTLFNLYHKFAILNENIDEYAEISDQINSSNVNKENELSTEKTTNYLNIKECFSLNKSTLIHQMNEEVVDDCELIDITEDIDITEEPEPVQSNPEFTCLICYQPSNAKEESIIDCDYCCHPLYHKRCLKENKKLSDLLLSKERTIEFVCSDCENS